MLLAFASLAAELAASVLSPAACAACSTEVPSRTLFCRSCASTLVAAPGGRERRAAAFLYGGAIAQAVTQFKYGPQPHLARPLAALLARALPQLATFEATLVVPVPLHPTRLAERGFNQSALLAHPIARALHATFAPLTLLRTRDTPKQASLDRDARRANVHDAFRVRSRANVRGANVLLVDDVETTGATLNACEAALRNAGSVDVASIVIARSIG